jgi:hypothetical protein
VESEGPAETYRAVIDGETQDEPVGQRWGKVESALLRRRRSHSPTANASIYAALRAKRTLRRLDPVGEKQNQQFQLSFNPSLKADSQGSRVTSDSGLLLVRELD